ncbi:luciferase-like monooxygenase family protein [Mycobacterium kansasii]|uniref:Luciferase-like monooxygenase family protein n=1 Tax=Mycobacterium kansasii TaxID=1768 RepID=A0A1V3WUY7_MYCKA|nr:luciferase-like monooxygenase family protein [Mycobacterium kansasii]
MDGRRTRRRRARRARITKAADNAGRPAPRIVAGVPVCLCSTTEVDAARERANRILGEAEVSPNYQRLLGTATPKTSAISARPATRTPSWPGCSDSPTPV